MISNFFKRFTCPRARLWVTTEKRELSLGDELKGIVGLKSEEEFDIEGIIVKLRCWESIKRISGHYETDEETSEKEWVEEEYWDKEKVYSQYSDVCTLRHINIGFSGEFPFAFKIPVTERETYHGADRKVEWFIGAIMPVRKRRHVKTQIREILIARPQVLKEVIREVVLIPCTYCGGLMPQTAIFCPNCGARRRAQ